VGGHDCWNVRSPCELVAEVSPPEEVSIGALGRLTGRVGPGSLGQAARRGKVLLIP
jgi:hypothetical protein